MALELVNTTIKAASRWVEAVHRHHTPPRGGLWAVAVHDDGRLCAVAIVGRPVARVIQERYPRWGEVTRVASDGTPNTCSMLYSACRRAAKALGYRRLITYLLAEEPATTLRALKEEGWRDSGIYSDGGSWNSPARVRSDPNPTGPKQRWEVDL